MFRIKLLFQDKAIMQDLADPLTIDWPVKVEEGISAQCFDKLILPREPGDVSGQGG